MFSIIIPNYNGAKFLPDCLESVFTAIKNCPDSKSEIILVDNGSADDSLIIAQSYPSVKIIKNQTNLGFAAAVNQGILAAKNNWVVLLNNDLTVAPDWLLLISQAIKKSDSALYSCYCGTVLNKNGDKFESRGLNFNIKGKCNNISNGLNFDPKSLATADCQIWGSSAALVVYNKNIITKIGLFDEDFFAYEEDVDVALRLNKLKLKTCYVPSALSYHLGGGTSRQMGNFRHRMDAKNWFFIITKNYSKKEFLNNFWSILEERLRNLSGLIKNTPIHLLPWSLVTTYGTVLKLLPSMFRKRKQIQILLKSHHI